MSNLVDDLKSDIDSILSIRDEIGAYIEKVEIVTRSWTGLEIGSGSYSDVSVPLKPTPRIVEYGHDFKVKEGGSVQQGDLMLKMVSKQSYPNQSDVDFTLSDKSVEKFYKIRGKLYRPIKVIDKHVVWSVLVRPISKK